MVMWSGVSFALNKKVFDSSYSWIDEYKYRFKQKLLFVLKRSKIGKKGHITLNWKAF